jgi:hypothetical protein
MVEVGAYSLLSNLTPTSSSQLRQFKNTWKFHPCKQCGCPWCCGSNSRFHSIARPQLHVPHLPSPTLDLQHITTHFASCHLSCDPSQRIDTLNISNFCQKDNTRLNTSQDYKFQRKFSHNDKSQDHNQYWRLKPQREQNTLYKEDQHKHQFVEKHKRKFTSE